MMTTAEYRVLLVVGIAYLLVALLLGLL